MKNIKICIAFLLMLAVLAVFSWAEPYRADINRINDYTHSIKEADLAELNETLLRVVDVFKFDTPICLKTEYNQTFGSFADDFFNGNGFGYGTNKNGLMLLIGTDNDMIYIKGYGAGAKIFTEEEKAKLIDSMRELRAQNMSWLACAWTYTNAILKVLKQHKDILAEYADGNIVEAEPKRNAPDWWPKDVNAFKDFHDEKASRVIDDAHIFSKEEIAVMKERIKKIQDENDFDLVVFTDKTSYGWSHGLYAADFHHFNGYGFGDDFSGTVLFICMKEGDRGWWTAATGKCQGIYTEKVINAIDDNLEPYMKGGKYGEGVINYLDDVYNLYKLPDWYPKNPEKFEPFKAENKPHVVDQTGVFTEEQKAEIEKQAAELSLRYGTDFVVLTTDKTIRNGTIANYARDFAKYNGYGEGENSDACVLCLKLTEQGSWFSIASTLSEEGRKCYTDKNLTNILGHSKKKLLKRGPYEAALQAISFADKMYSKGRVWHEIYFIWPIWLCALLGLIVAVCVLDPLEASMGSIKDKKDCFRYYVEGSFQVTGEEDVFIKTYSTTKQRESSYSSYSSSSHSSSGRSSYSSSYKSSGGRSYSGGGRKF
ncbi:MAG: TPM domain-containing protein [Spirochaetaceae bacterium]|nr:TPM domain-containing protein [Spirochaetaceae bacterium]